jgi:hypothetical protein
MYDRIVVELKGVQQALYSNRTVSTAPLSSEGIELGDEPAQLRRLEDSKEFHLHCVQEEKEKATKALKKEKEEAIEQRRFPNKKKMTSRKSLQRIEHRSRRRKNSFSQSRLELKKQSLENFSL